MSLEESQACDLVVIGAGIYGIQAARTFLEVHPSANIVVLEASGSIGGVWSRGELCAVTKPMPTLKFAVERVYGDFWTQTPLGILEFSDLPMQDVPQSDTYYGFFKASHVMTYLEGYCKSHRYSGLSLESRIQLDTSVQRVFKEDLQWIIEAQNGAKTVRFRTPFVIDATGLTSNPNWPDLPGWETFKGEIIHHKAFAKFEASPAAASMQNVVVIGGAKSAADVAYSLAKAGKNVTWIIRRSGSGPAAFASAKGSLAYANSNEFFYTRLTSLFLVSLFAVQTRFSRLASWVNKTRIGQSVLRNTWTHINTGVHAEARYDRPEGQANGFFNLRPDTELFWQNDSTGVNQRDDFFEVIANNVKVFREDIAFMEQDSIVLGDESRTHVPADVVICATGWKATHPFLDEETASQLGLPGDPKLLDEEVRLHWQRLEQSAKSRMLHHFPILDSPWAHGQKCHHNSDTGTTPYRLWKSIVPVKDRSFLFLGRVMLGNHFRAAEVQALFACAVIDGYVPSPPKEDMEASIAETVAWCRRRYLKKGQAGNWFYWDMLPYTDMMLAELGLSSHRSKSWMKDLARPAYAKDLRSLVDEYVQKREELNLDGKT